MEEEYGLRCAAPSHFSIAFTCRRWPCFSCLLLTTWQDDDHQSKFIPPTPAQEAVATAKHTWDNFSVASVKDGLSTVAALAAKEASARLPTAVAEYAATARDYVSQAVRGSPHKVSVLQQSGGVGYGNTDWEPPVNSFTLVEEARARSPSPDWRSDKAVLRELEKDRRRGMNGADKLDHCEKAALEQQRHSTGAKHPSQNELRAKEQTGPVFERDKLYYDPLGVSSEWKRAHEFDERTRQRKQRLSEDWKNKEEKDNNTDRRRPELKIQGEVTKTKALTRRTAHGLAEREHQSDEESNGWTKQKMHGLGESKHTDEVLFGYDYTDNVYRSQRSFGRLFGKR